MKAKRKVASVLAIILCLGILAQNGATVQVEATSDTRHQITETEKEKDLLEQQLDQTAGELDDLRGEHKSLRSELKRLNEELTAISDNLESLSIQITEKEQAIILAQEEIAAAKQVEAQQYDSMVEQVRRMYRQGERNVVALFFEADDLTAASNALDFYEKILQYDRKMMEQYQENRRRIEEAEAALQADKVALDNLKVAAEAEKSRVSGLISQTSASITQYADQISDAEEAARAVEEEIAQKEKDLEYLKKKLAEEIALSQKAANAVWRDISQVTFAEGDLQLLASIIYCEAGSEPYEGKLAVGSVVINRVLSGVFPDTVIGVVYQNKQFSPVASGRLALALSEGRATQSCYQAAQEAMSGASNVGNCLFFRTPVEGLSGINIGGHVFY